MWDSHYVIYILSRYANDIEEMGITYVVRLNKTISKYAKVRNHKSFLFNTAEITGFIVLVLILYDLCTRIYECSYVFE